MDKPKKSIFVYLIGIYLFIFMNAFTAPFIKKSKEYISDTGNVNYLNNQITALIILLMLILIIQIIRYKKIFFYIGGVFFILNSLLNIYIAFFLYKKFFTWIDIVLIINICCCVFLFRKKSIAKCKMFSEYYKQQKQIKEMQKRL